MGAPFGPLICTSTSMMAMDLISPPDRGVLTAIPEVRSWARSSLGSSAAQPNAMTKMVDFIFWANMRGEIIRLMLLLCEPQGTYSAISEPLRMREKNTGSSRISLLDGRVQWEGSIFRQVFSAEI